MAGKTLYDKLWEQHVVKERDDGTALIYIDRQLLHEVTSPQAFEGLRIAGRKPWRLDANLAARFGQHELALRRCLTRPQPESTKAEAASAPAQKARPKAPRRRGSNWMDDFDLKKSLPVWKAARASGTRPADALS